MQHGFAERVSGVYLLGQALELYASAVRWCGLLTRSRILLILLVATAVLSRYDQDLTCNNGGGQ